MDMDDRRFRIAWRECRAGACLLAILVALLPVLLGGPAAATPATSAAETTEADLWLDASGSALPRYVGWTGPLVYVVGNFGPATATGVTATFEIPTGLGAVGEPCTTTDAGQICTTNLEPRPAGSSPRSSIAITAEAPGSYAIRVSATADQPDPVPTNNVETITVVVVPNADVSVQVTDSADPSLPGRPVTYAVTVTNNGPSPATEVALTGTWRTSATGGVKLLSFHTSQGACSPSSGAGLTCMLGALGRGSSASVTVTLRPRGKGTLTSTASVTAAEFDSDMDNNTDSETTTIGAATSR
jgi:uncharacterized repeat protein (TIGR01451 family)